MMALRAFLNSAVTVGEATAFSAKDIVSSAMTSAQSELLGILEKQGCDFIIFRQHYQEVLQTFNSTIHLLYTKD